MCLARVGDSSAFVLAGAEWEELFPGRADEELRGSVIGVLPLGSRGEGDAIETASVALPAGAALVLLTDGVADPLRDGPSTVAPALAEILSGGPSGTLTPSGPRRCGRFQPAGLPGRPDRSCRLAPALGRRARGPLKCGAHSWRRGPLTNGRSLLRRTPRPIAPALFAVDPAAAPGRGQPPLRAAPPSW